MQAYSSMGGRGSRRQRWVKGIGNWPPHVESEQERGGAGQTARWTGQPFTWGNRNTEASSDIWGAAPDSTFPIGLDGGREMQLY